MKHIAEIGTPEYKQKYTQEQYRKVTAFVASVYQLFTDYRGEFTREEFFKDECRTWADEIIGFSNDAERLDKLKKLVAVSSMHGLHGNYRTAKAALAIACQSMDHLNHDFGIAYPKSGFTGELERIKREEKKLLESNVDHKAHINRLKEIF